MHPAGRKSSSSLKLSNDLFWWLQLEFCVILWTVSYQVLHSRFWKLIPVNTQHIGFSTRKVLNVRYFNMLNVYLGGLLFMKFNVTENMRYCLSHFICLLISIYTNSFAWNLFICQNKPKKWKIDKLSHIGGRHICIMLPLNLTPFCFKKYWYFKESTEVFYLFTLYYRYNTTVIFIQEWDIRMADIFGFIK